jgi:ribosome-binding protein aMBF1 (putative translation factor)
LGIFLLDFIQKMEYTVKVPSFWITITKERRKIMSVNFYDNVEAERARNHFTIAELAEKLDVDERTYRKWRDENTDLKASYIKRFADIFGCSSDYLLGLTDKIRRKDS